MKARGVLLLLPDCPGYFTQLFLKFGEFLKSEGYRPIFASTSPFYDRFKKIDLEKVGPVYYLDSFLEKELDLSVYEKFPIDNWSYYASFSRQSYFYGRYWPDTVTLKKTKLFFQTIIDQNDVTLGISEGVSNAFLYLAHQQLTASHVPFFGLMSSRIPYHYNIHTDITGNEVLVNNDAPAKYIASDAVPDYMKNSQFGGLFDKDYALGSLSFFKELFLFIFLKNFHSLEVGNSKSYLLRVYKIAMRRILANFYFHRVIRIYDKDLKFSAGKKCVVYPLHFYPEASTSIFAKYYDGDEYSVIKNIAFSLPEDTVLVVKEHKSNVGNNGLSFYKKIKNLPNTVLLDPYFNLRDNIDKFDAVITISSTAGFEALTKNVPVYVFGEVFYQNYPGVHKITSYAALEIKLKELRKKSTHGHSDVPLDIYSRICFPGSFNYMSASCLLEENVALLMKPVLNYFNTNELHKHRNDLQ
jgi:hypothetical protein